MAKKSIRDLSFRVASVGPRTGGGVGHKAVGFKGGFVKNAVCWGIAG